MKNEELYKDIIIDLYLWKIRIKMKSIKILKVDY